MRIVSMVAAIGAAAAAVVLSQVGSGPARMGHNALEYTYVQFAKRLASLSASSDPFSPSPDTLPAALALCDRIAPDAVDLSLAWGGFEIWSWRYLRSHCVQEIAASSGVPDLCDRVRVLEGRPLRPLLGREIPVTPAACREGAGHGPTPGWAEFGTETIVRLLGYSAEQVAARTSGRTLEEGGASDFVSDILLGRGDDVDQEQYDRRRDDFVARLRRLPDFSQGDAAAHRQLDSLAPGWSSPSNGSRLAQALRCAIERLPPGRALSTDCLDRM